MKIPRYNATTLGGGNDYCMEPDEDGSLCSTYDVEKLEAREAALLDIVKEQTRLLAMYRTGSFGRGGAIIAKLEKARKALHDAGGDA